MSDTARSSRCLTAIGRRRSRRPLRPARSLRCLLGAAGLGLAVSASLAAQAGAPPSAKPPANPVPRLRSQGAISTVPPGELPAVRLMVFSLEHQRVFDALNVVRPLLSMQGSVELDPHNNTISVRDNFAALSRVATAIRAFDRDNRPVRIDVQLIHAEIAKISPVKPTTGIAPDLLQRLRQLLRFQTFSLLAHSQIESREGEAVVYDMAQGYRLSFEVGTVFENQRIRLSGFRMVRAAEGRAESELVRSVVNLGLDQPLILGLTRDEAADHALMLVLRFQNAAAAAAGQ
jgi:hypothetical protein